VQTHPCAACLSNRPAFLPRSAPSPRAAQAPADSLLSTVPRLASDLRECVKRALKRHLLERTSAMLHAIADADYRTYEAMCDPHLTAFEPEARVRPRRCYCTLR
jgi:hypothetical protein